MTLSLSHPMTRALTSSPPPSPAARPSKAPRTRQIPSPPPRRDAQRCPIRPRTGPAPRTPHPAPRRPLPAARTAPLFTAGRRAGSRRSPPPARVLWRLELREQTYTAGDKIPFDRFTDWQRNQSSPYFIFFFFLKNYFTKSGAM